MEPPERTIEIRPGAGPARTARPAAEQPRMTANRAGLPPLVEERTSKSQSEGNRTNFVSNPGTKTNSIGPHSAKPVKNAILAPRSNNERSLPGDDLFRDLHIPVLQVEIPAEGIAGLRRSPRRYVRASIQEGAVTYTNVAIHLKGGPGSYRQLQDMPSFTLNFDRFAPGQTFHGLKKIHLNNSVQDRSLISEKISRELFEAAGVPVPRAGNASVTFNGQELGLYVLVEGVNKQFLKRYFKDVKGNVYDGHSGTDVTDNLPTNSGENPRDKSRLRAIALATQEPLDTRLASLEKTLDVDRFLSFLAMEAILWHWDGYTINRNNFRIFHDRDSDRMVFLPHGLDQVLSKPKGSIFPPTAGLVARAFLEIPEGRRLYRERVAQLSTNVFRPEAIISRVHEVAEKIDTVLAETDARAASSHRQRVNGFCSRVRQRASYLEDLVSPASRARFENLASAPLTDWRPQLDLGEARLTQEQDNEGSSLFHISTQDGCTASWRTSRLLDSGKYRFEARLKTQGVVLNPDDPRAGAGLRISRHRVGQKNSGDRDWAPITFDFEVTEDQSTVELVCELRATQGDVWFDARSLKLRRK